MRIVPSLALLSLITLSTLAAHAAEIKGAGSSAAQPLYDSLAPTPRPETSPSLTSRAGRAMASNRSAIKLSTSAPPISP